MRNCNGLDRLITENSLLLEERFELKQKLRDIEKQLMDNDIRYRRVYNNTPAPTLYYAKNHPDITSIEEALNEIQNN